MGDVRISPGEPTDGSGLCEVDVHAALASGMASSARRVCDLVTLHMMPAEETALALRHAQDCLLAGIASLAKALDALDENTQEAP